MPIGAEWLYSFFMLFYFIPFHLGLRGREYKIRLDYLHGDAVAKYKSPLNNPLEVHLVNDTGYLVTQFPVDLDHVVLSEVGLVVVLC